jgi:hypothetical protein
MSCDAVGGVPAPEPGWESTWTQASADVQATADAASSSGAGPPPNNVIVDVLDRVLELPTNLGRSWPWSHILVNRQKTYFSATVW